MINLQHRIDPVIYAGLNIKLDQKYGCDKPGCLFCMLLAPKRDRPKIDRKPINNWSEEQAEFLSVNFHTMSTYGLMHHLNKSVWTIKRKGRQLGLGEKTHVYDAYCPAENMDDRFNGWF